MKDCSVGVNECIVVGFTVNLWHLAGNDNSDVLRMKSHQPFRLVSCAQSLKHNGNFLSTGPGYVRTSEFLITGQVSAGVGIPDVGIPGGVGVPRTGTGWVWSAIPTHPTPWFWHVVMVTKAGATHPTGMLSCSQLPVLHFIRHKSQINSSN